MGRSALSRARPSGRRPQLFRDELRLLIVISSDNLNLGWPVNICRLPIEIHRLLSREIHGLCSQNFSS